MLALLEKEIIVVKVYLSACWAFVPSVGARSLRTKQQWITLAVTENGSVAFQPYSCVEVHTLLAALHGGCRQTGVCKVVALCPMDIRFVFTSNFIALRGVINRKSAVV